MSFALREQTMWTCSVCGRECPWSTQPYEVLHQQTRDWHRFVCDSCINVLVRQFRKDELRVAKQDPGAPAGTVSGSRALSLPGIHSHSNALALPHVDLP
jgi:hypothetical protein